MSELLPAKRLKQTGENAVLWRGETSGIAFETFDLSETYEQLGFFFSSEQTVAESYTNSHNKVLRTFHLQIEESKLLDLTDPHGPNKKVRKFINEFHAEHDDWTDPHSGEPMHFSDFLEAGDLYNLDFGNRWKSLFRYAFASGFDPILVYDCSEVTPHIVVVTRQQPLPITCPIQKAA